MRNLVLGSEGFVGTYFCKYLERIGEQVTHCDIKLTDKDDLRFKNIDLSNIDRVYFLAWDVGGAKYLYRHDTQMSQLQWNLHLMQNVFPQLIDAKIPFLFISSQLADDVDSVYGVTKRLGEKWAKLGNGRFVRLWNVYGPVEEESEKTHVVSDFVTQAVKNKEIRMLTTGTEKRQFVHVEDVSRAFHTAIESNFYETVDVTSFEWVRVIDLANIIAAYTGAKVIPGERIGSTPITPIYGKLPHWNPEISLEEGLKKMVDECKNTL
jgi:nucleoside-diphosphate-sugar epimerase